MNIEQLRTFLTCVENRTFYEAAEQLYISPGTVTKHINALEKEFNVTLFDRTSQGIRITEEGSQRLGKISRLVAAWDDLEGVSGTESDITKLNIYVADHPGMYRMDGLIKEFQETYPTIRVQVHVAKRLWWAVNEQEKEMGFVSLYFLNQEKYDYIAYTTGNLGIIVSQDHPFAQLHEVSIEQLKDEIFVELATGALRLHSNFCKRFGFGPRIEYQVPREDAELFYVRNDLAIAFFQPELTRYYNMDGIRYIPLQERFACVNGLVKLKETKLSKNAELFWNFTEKYFRNLIIPEKEMM